MTFSFASEKSDANSTQLSQTVSTSSFLSVLDSDSKVKSSSQYTKKNLDNNLSKLSTELNRELRNSPKKLNGSRELFHFASETQGLKRLNGSREVSGSTAESSNSPTEFRGSIKRLNGSKEGFSSSGECGPMSIPLRKTQRERSRSLSDFDACNRQPKKTLSRLEKVPQVIVMFSAFLATHLI
jgi:hypothetical protein